MEEPTDFLVIGAGLAGLAFVQDAGNAATVRVLDKGRGIGGRMATRLLGTGEDTVRVDHGAQFFTAKSEKLSGRVRDWLEADKVRVWSYGFPAWDGTQIVERPEGHARYAMVGGMNEMAKLLRPSAEVKTGVIIQRLERSGDLWVAHGVQSPDNTPVVFAGKHLILNLPAPQLLPLVSVFVPEDVRKRLEKVTFSPCQALILRLARDIEVDWPAVDFDGKHPVLGFLSRDHTKRNPGAPPVLVAHGSGAWSATHREDDPTRVQEALIEAVQSVVGPLEIIEAQVHRWRYAQPTNFYGDEPSVWLDDLKLGFCGDWVSSSRVEGALESGWHLAHRLQPGETP